MPSISANGLDLEYERLGSGEPVLLIMGLGAQLIHWHDDFCAQLVDRGFEVIRFDNRDVGKSTWLDPLGVPDVRRALVKGFMPGLVAEAPYTLTDMANDAAALLDGLGLASAHVVGVSMGGMIAQTMAIAHPARVRSLVSIMSTPGSRRHSLARPHALKAILSPMPKGREARIERTVETFRVIHARGFPFPEDAIRALATAAYDRGFHPAGFARQFAAILASGSRTRALAHLRVPTTVIHGTLDPLVPPAGGAATAQAIPNARLQWVEGMGHSLPREAWGLIADAIVDNSRRTR